MKEWQIKLLLIVLTCIGAFQIVYESFSILNVVQEEPVSYLEDLKIGEEEVPLSGYGFESFISNEKSEVVTAKPKDGWEVTEVRYYPENDLNLKGGKKGNATRIIYNNVSFGVEKKSQKKL